MTERAPRRLSRLSLYSLVWQRPMSGLAADYGLSANGLAKVCDRLLIPYPPRGHWARIRRGDGYERPPLPPAPETVEDMVVFAKERSGSRRPQTRMSPMARRSQLLDAAVEIILAEGLHGVTTKAVARKVGISEAQAHNYFQRDELLLALARRELGALEASRQSQAASPHDSPTRITLATLEYLRQTHQRGALIPILLSDPHIRGALRQEREAQRSAMTEEVSQRLVSRYGVPAEVAKAMTAVQTAVILRAGRLLSAGKLSLPAAERLTLAVVMGGHWAMVEHYGSERAAVAGLRTAATR